LTGSRFDKTANPILNLGANPAVVIGGNTSGASTDDSVVIPVQVSNGNTLVGTGANASGLQLKLLPTGLVRGKFTSSVTGKNTQLQGVMIQNTNAAFGYFLSTGTRGFFEVRDQTAQ